MANTQGSIAMIVNPKSGYGGRKLLWRGLHRYLIDRRYEVKLDFTTSLGHASELAHQADADPRCAMVVVAGGDGTVREAAHGMAGSAKPFLIAPCGTENLLASELGLDNSLQTMISTFESGFTRPLDLGVINGQCFTCLAGFGFDGEVVARVHRRRKGHIDYYDYLDPLWQTFWSYRFWPFRVHADGQEIFHGRGLVFIGNISRYALGLHLLQNADFGDGLLDLCVFRCTHQVHLLKHSVMTLLKRHTTCRDVVYVRCKQALVEAGTPKAVCEVDGDPGPVLPAQVSVNPAALRVLVPEKGRPAGLRRSFLRHLIR
jgi:diacylglycerol kinase (ATP)